MNKRGVYAVSQISLLILGIFAFVFIISESSLVEAGGTGTSANKCQAGVCRTGYVCNSATGLCEKRAEALEAKSSGIGMSDVSKAIGIATLPSQIEGGLKSAKKFAAKLGLGKDIADATKAAEVAADLAKDKVAKGLISQKLFGSSTYWTHSGAEAAGMAAAGKAGGSWLIGEGAMTSGGFFHGVAVVAVSAAIAFAAGVVVRYLAQTIGASVKQSQTLGAIGGSSVFAGLIVASISTGPVGWVIGGVVAVFGIFGFYKLESSEIVMYQCLPFTPESKGAHCEDCNGGILPCTEYQCKSLGRACEMFDVGSENELCVEVARDDIIPPVISAWEDALPDNYVYNPLTTNFPEDRGVRVINKNTASGCVGPFEEVTFGITLNEPAICKESSERYATWDEMGAEFMTRGDGHNYTLSRTYVDKAAVEAEGFEYEEGFNEVFIRCEDAQENQNLANFVFRFCVDESPDMTTSQIMAVSPMPYSLIKFNQSSVNATFYVDKPSTCKWDRVDRTYEQMENEMTCAETVGDAQPYQYTMAYPCETELTGIANYVDNNYFIRCKSYPQKNESERVVMENSFQYTLTGTRPLTIQEASPNETIRGSSEIMEVELYVRTAAGANDEGLATCYFSQTDSDAKYIAFFNTNSYEHSQSLWLSPGAYKYYFKCSDLGGNVAKTEVNFIVESDTEEPLVARAYSEDGFLKLATNEEARCVYSTFGCDYPFEDGIMMSHEEYINHFTPWDSTMNLYVKCEDIYSNRPLAQSECSIVVRAYDEFVDPNN